MYIDKDLMVLINSILHVTYHNTFVSNHIALITCHEKNLQVDK